MSFCSECENVQCIEVFASMCQPYVDSGIRIPADGIYKCIIEFNGTVQYVPLKCKEGYTFIFNNIFNLNYSHNVRIYTPQNELLNNTCYTFNMSLVTSLGENITPTPLALVDTCYLTVEITENPDETETVTTCSGVKVRKQYAPGTEVTILTEDGEPFLIGTPLTFTPVLANIPIQEAVFDITTGTIAYDSFYSPSLLTIQYAQSL